MKRLFNLLFRRQITFGRNVKNYVQVYDTKNKGVYDELFLGFIETVDFNKRTVSIAEAELHTLAAKGTRVLPFDSIVSISRMKDGRLRMWINVA